MMKFIKHATCKRVGDKFQKYFLPSYIFRKTSRTKMKNYCFISSMFRSGSTLLARMLDRHPHLACASDPIRPIFNSYRYDIAKDEFKKKHKRFDPLGDYFLEDCDLLDRILKGKFKTKPEISFRELFSVVKERALMFSGNWAQALEEKEYQNYREYITYFIGQIDKVYGKGKNTFCILFKEVWATEFFSALKRILPNLKCIILIRDPRGIVASKNATGNPYPYFFMGRQWRKLAYLSAYMKMIYQNEVYLLRYEDLVSQPEHYVRELCGFLKIEFKKDLLDLTKYRDGSGKSWFQNTSYNMEIPKCINAKSVDKWKSILEDRDIRSIEMFCYDWMEYFGYKIMNKKSNLQCIKADEFRVFENERLARWIQQFAFENDKEWLSNQMIIEKMRLSEHHWLSKKEKSRLQLKWW